MNKRSIFFILMIAVPLFAQNFNDAFRLGEQNLDYDAKTLSLGNSTIGAFGNFSSSLINPAGLGTIKRDIFSMSFNSNSFTNSNSFLNYSNETERSNGNINQMSLVMPLPVKKGSAVIAFGYSQGKDYNSIVNFEALNNNNTSLANFLTYSDFIVDREFAWDLGLNSEVPGNTDEYETPINGGLYQQGDIVTSGTLDSWVMSGAVEVAKNLFIGGTFNIISGEYRNNRHYEEDDYSNNIYTGLVDTSEVLTDGFESFAINDIITWDMSGWDFRLGLLYKINNFLNFGANIKFPTNYTVKEKYSIYGKSVFTNNYFELDDPGEKFEYEISSPMELSAGLSASFSLFTVNGSFKVVDYSQLEFTHGFNDDEMFELNNEIQEIFETTVNWNLGAEFTLPYPALKIRGGFIYNPSPYIGDDTDFDKKYFTAGLGFPIAKKLLFDFAYVHGWWSTYTDNYDVEVSRVNQDISLNKLVFSVSYIFL